MCTPTLYVDDRSPPVRSILMLIEELKLTAAITIQTVDLFKRENWSESYLKISPMHTVPSFVHDDLVLNDSHSILGYLAETYGGGGGDLWPDDSRGRSKVIDRLLFNATILFRRDSEVFSEIFRSQPSDISEHLQKLEEILKMMELFLQNTKYMAGDKITVADLSIVATLSTVNLILPLAPNKWPRLAEWYQEMSERPSFVKGNLPGLMRLRAVLMAVSKCKIY